MAGDITRFQGVREYPGFWFYVIPAHAGIQRDDASGTIARRCFLTPHRAGFPLSRE